MVCVVRGHLAVVVERSRGDSGRGSARRASGAKGFIATRHSGDLGAERMTRGLIDQIDGRRAPSLQVVTHLVDDGLQGVDGCIVWVVDVGNRDLGEQLAEQRGMNEVVWRHIRVDVLEVGGGVAHV